MFYNNFSKLSFTPLHLLAPALLEHPLLVCSRLPFDRLTPPRWLHLPNHPRRTRQLEYLRGRRLVGVDAPPGVGDLPRFRSHSQRRLHAQIAGVDVVPSGRLRDLRLDGGRQFPDVVDVVAAVVHATQLLVDIGLRVARNQPLQPTSQSIADEDGPRGHGGRRRRQGLGRLVLRR